MKTATIITERNGLLFRVPLMPTGYFRTISIRDVYTSLRIAYGENVLSSVLSLYRERTAKRTDIFKGSELFCTLDELRYLADLLAYAVAIHEAKEPQQ